nr:MAG TPA: hypothetical protein [Caudoviricetes sp.]
MKKTETEFIECLSKDLDDLVIKFVQNPEVYFQELPSVNKLDEGNRLFMKVLNFKKPSAWNTLLADLKYIGSMPEHIEKLTKEPHPLYPYSNDYYRNVKFRNLKLRDAYGITRTVFAFSYIKNGTEHIVEFNNYLIDVKDLEN